MTVFSLFQIASRSLDSAVGLFLPSSNRGVFLRDEFRQGHLDVGGNALDFSHAFFANLLQERQKRVVMEPC